MQSISMDNCSYTTLSLVFDLYRQDNKEDLVEYNRKKYREKNGNNYLITKKRTLPTWLRN